MTDIFKETNEKTFSISIEHVEQHFKQLFENVESARYIIDFREPLGLLKLKKIDDGN